MPTRFGRTPSFSATKRSNSAFAFPSTAGALILIFNLPPTQPTTSLRLALGVI
jgi:hypothetical protein